MRLELWSGGFFGDVEFEEAVQAAWCQFKLWKRRNKVSCSQPSLKASHVDRFDYRHFFSHQHDFWSAYTLYLFVLELNCMSLGLWAAPPRWLPKGKHTGTSKRSTAGSYVHFWVTAQCRTTKNVLRPRLHFWQHVCLALRYISPFFLLISQAC